MVSLSNHDEDSNIPKERISALQKAFNAVAKMLHRTGKYAYKDKEVKTLHKELNSTLQHALSSNITAETPPDMLNTLKENVFLFSGMKTYAQLKELSGYLVEDGKPASWNSFYQKTEKANAVHNKHYLEAEYQYTVGTAQAVDKYNHYQKDGDRYNLQIRTVQDDRVRDSHEAMHGITKPANDPFWDTHWIPFGWRCRCNIIQVLKDDYPVTDTDTATQKANSATPELFRYNPAKKGVVFPPEHPYYAQHCGKKLNVSGNIALAMVVLSNEKEKCEWQKEVKEEQAKFINRERKKEVYAKPVYDQYKTIHPGAKGVAVQIHETYNKEKAIYKQELYAAKAWAKVNKDVRMQPEIHASEKEARKRIFPNLKSESSNPDLWITNQNLWM